MPAVITAGGTHLQNSTPRLARELETGAIIHVVQIQTGRHRGWFTAEQPPGSKPQRVTVWAMHRAVGKILDDVRAGQVFEVFNARDRRVLGYLSWSCPEVLARLETSLQYTTRTRSGRAVYRDIYPLAVEAVPPPPRRGVLANAGK